MKETLRSRNIILVATALSATAGIATALGSYVRHEMKRRGYPSWQECRCDFKAKRAVFQVWYSRHERQGETIVAHEWGAYLPDLSPWLRRFLHYGSQVCATLNPRGRYVERVALSPQEALQFALLLHAVSSVEELPEGSGQIVWRREVLHVPRHLFDAYILRLYPVHVSAERREQMQSLPALWDPHSDLPLPSQGLLLELPVGTRIDYIGWTPSQISYCTARLATI